ncbi:MAG TPA: hypothetical protein VHY79_06110 [Rhizomicrobium sp.]|jgi:hypothetical protein|nr:hypothetical protein [Rhizomicrobium sp.]
MARIPIFILAALTSAAIGFGASHVLDTGTMAKLAADRDQARNCRHSASTIPPCPVEYRNTRIVWREKVVTTRVPDPRQAERITSLSADLADAQRSIRELERRLTVRWAPRPAVYYYLQNGTMAHPYATSDRCPAEATVMYVAQQSLRSMPRRHSGDPNVCYVRLAQRR